MTGLTLFVAVVLNSLLAFAWLNWHKANTR